MGTQAKACLFTLAKTMVSKLKSRHGWAAIAVYAILHDNLCPDGQTISEGFWRARKWWAIPAWVWLTGHLLVHWPLPVRFLKVTRPS